MRCFLLFALTAIRVFSRYTRTRVNEKPSHDTHSPWSLRPSISRMGKSSINSHNWISQRHPTHRCLHLFLLVATGLGLRPPVANPAIDLQSPSLSIFNTSNAFPTIPSASKPYSNSNAESAVYLDDDVQLLNVTYDGLECNGGLYGRDLDKDSCVDAWRSIPTDNEYVTYGARGQGHFEVPLPVRYLSSDGKCAIDIKHGAHSVSDAARNAEVSAAVKRLLDACVLRDRRGKINKPLGGRLSRVGRDGGLNVYVRKYSPDVECIAEPPFDDHGGCSEVLNTMLISQFSLTFARERTSATRNVIIPAGGKKIAEGTSPTCTATIDLVDVATARGTWFEVWEAAVAVNEICVKKGKAGISFGQGLNIGLMISLGP